MHVCVCSTVYVGVYGGGGMFMGVWGVYGVCGVCVYIHKHITYNM